MLWWSVACSSQVLTWVFIPRVQGWRFRRRHSCNVAASFLLELLGLCVLSAFPHHFHRNVMRCLSRGHHGKPEGEGGTFDIRHHSPRHPAPLSLVVPSSCCKPSLLSRLLYVYSVPDQRCEHIRGTKKTSTVSSIEHRWAAPSTRTRGHPTNQCHRSSTLGSSVFAKLPVRKTVNVGANCCPHFFGAIVGVPVRPFRHQRSFR